MEVKTFIPKNINQNLMLRTKINNRSIQQSKTTTCLGVMIHLKMSWKEHIHIVTAKLRIAVNFDILRKVYFVLSYGLIFEDC